MTAADVPELGARVLLAIDTSIGTSVALGAQGQVFELMSDDSRGHAERIGPMLADVFQQSGVAPSDVTGVVAGIGPGPFTGLRIGIAAAQSFAFARGVPLLPLQGHEAVAFERIAAGAEQVRVVQDAKRRELFVTDFDGLDADGIPNRTGGPRIVSRADYEPAEITPGGSPSEEAWPERISAASLVRLAALRLATEREFEPDRALYLRAPDVKAPGPVKRVST